MTKNELIEYWEKQKEIYDNMRKMTRDATNNAVYTIAAYQARDILTQLKTLNYTESDYKTDFINHLRQLHPELSSLGIEDLYLFCESQTITQASCYGNGEIMYPKWQAKIARYIRENTNKSGKGINP